MRWFSRREEIPDDLWNRTLRAHPVLNELTSDEQTRLRPLAEEFLGTMQIRWARELEPRRPPCVALALLACLPVLNLGLRWYRRWRTVLLVPYHYETESVEIDEAGVVHEGVTDAAGEFAELGTVVLSLDDIRNSGKGTGFNVVIHECAHVLDSANGSLDGLPPLHKEMSAAHWAEVFGEAYEDLQQRLLRPARRSPGSRTRRSKSAFDPYAAEAPEEFFAVATELFFERPRRLHSEYPDLYQQLALFYRQDRV